MIIKRILSKVLLIISRLMSKKRVVFDNDLLGIREIITTRDKFSEDIDFKVPSTKFSAI